MGRRLFLRLRDIRTAIGDIEQLLAGRSKEEVSQDRISVAAFERFLEVISEASRHIPERLRESHGQAVPWRRIADLGNILRHAYHKTDFDTLWNIYTGDLSPLRQTIDAMMAVAQANANPPAPSKS